MSREPARDVMAEASWLAELRAHLAPSGYSIEVGLARSIVCRDEIPTDIELSSQRLHVRFTLRHRHAPSSDPVVLPGELGLECAFNAQRNVLEPIVPGALLDAGSARARALLAHLEQAGFDPDPGASPFMLVRDRQSHRLVEETRTMTYARRAPDAAEAAREIIALIEKIDAASR